MAPVPPAGEGRVGPPPPPPPSILGPGHMHNVLQFENPVPWHSSHEALQQRNHSHGSQI